MNRNRGIGYVAAAVLLTLLMCMLFSCAGRARNSVSPESASYETESSNGAEAGSSAGDAAYGAGSSYGAESSGGTASSSSATYGTKESYDAKYGEGAYEADSALLDSMRDSYNAAIGASGGGESGSGSSSGATYGTKESYDAKYGEGAYEADSALLESLRDSYNAAIGE